MLVSTHASSRRGGSTKPSQVSWRTIGSALIWWSMWHGLAFATMPSAPLTLTLASSGPAAVDIDLVVTLTARSFVGADRMSLELTLPEGVDLISGPTEWAGPVQADQTQVLTVTVRPRRAVNAVIRGVVRLEFPDGTVLGETRSLPIALDDRSKQGLGLGPPKRTITGEPVIEFRDPR